MARLLLTCGRTPCAPRSHIAKPRPRVGAVPRPQTPMQRPHTNAHVTPTPLILPLAAAAPPPHVAQRS
eukprot:1985482-Prymnesium_polylepis.1